VVGRDGPYGGSDGGQIKLEDGVVHLQRKDGKVVEVPLEVLSDADQEFVRSIAADPARPALPLADDQSGK
jgi:hypothetical protein